MLNKFFPLLLLLSSFSFAQVFGPKVAVQQVEHNFGEIIQGQKVSYNFIISNSGGDALKIENVKASCGCTVAKPDKTELAPGEGTNIKVTFDSSGKMGNEEKYVYVKTNDPDNSMLKLKINAVVVPPNYQDSTMTSKIIFPEVEHDFGTVVEGKVVDYTFNFKNVGKSTLIIKDIKTSCGCTAALASSKRLKPNEEGTLKVELDTKNRSGKMTRTISVYSNDPKDPIKILKVHADVTKKG